MTTTHLPGKARRGIALTADPQGVDGLHRRAKNGPYRRSASAARPATSRKARRGGRS